MASQSSEKPIHSLIIDTGPLIKNAVSISTMISSAEDLYTTPAIISEIRDAATRSRVETTLMPFLKIKNPSPASYEAVAAFAKKTGDFTVLSRQDLGILALAYEVHCQRHGGPLGLREVPGGLVTRKPGEKEKMRKKRDPKKKKADSQSGQCKQGDGEERKEEAETAASEEEWTQVKSGPKPKVVQESTSSQDQAIEQARLPRERAPKAAEQEMLSNTTPNRIVDDSEWTQVEKGPKPEFIQSPLPSESKATKAVERVPQTQEKSIKQETTVDATAKSAEISSTTQPLENGLANLQVSDAAPEIQDDAPSLTEDDSSSDGGWITASNLANQQAQDDGGISLSTQRTQMSVATMTTDFAMQNVLLQMNLNLLSTNMQRIRKVNSHIMRCHACFLTTKQMDKQFCPRCGQPTLKRVSCSTNAAGEFKLHLAKNYQYNNRGNRYSIPKPIAGTANGKRTGKGGGKNGWGTELLLTEDQKEYARIVGEGKKTQTRDLMDEDYLPRILTGERGRAGGRPKVGAGKNINSRKRF